MRATLTLLLLVLAATGCASGGGTTPATNQLLEVRLTFAAPVNADRFEYFLIFNLDNDQSQAPLITNEGFEDRDQIGLGWDVYYLLGTPAGQPASFYRGRGGTSTAGTPRTDGAGNLLILNVPARATGPEIVDTGIISGAVVPGGPTASDNTILWRFDRSDFPSVEGLPSNPARLRMSVVVTDRSIDSVENPDDGDANDTIIYERFFESAVRMELNTRSTWSEQTDPQESAEESKPVPLSGPYAAADLVNWTVTLVDV
ncbi:MAG: hypothetical protein ABI743_10990 [bacterium]